MGVGRWSERREKGAGAGAPLLLIGCNSEVPLIVGVVDPDDEPTDLDGDAVREEEFECEKFRPSRSIMTPLCAASDPLP
jgi:hypothetical protein